MADPLVSIIIPVYNAEKHVAETIASALAQTWHSIEIIVVDDGSTDNSPARVKAMAAPQLRLVSQVNRGASAARNTGLAHAGGKYVQFLDADDLLSPDKISRQVALLEKHPGKVAVCSTVHFDDGTDPAASGPTAYEEAFLRDSDDPAAFLISLLGGGNNRASMIQPNAWLTPSALIAQAGPWNETLTVDDDGEFFCRVLLHAAGIVKSGGYNYYRKFARHPKSLSSLQSKPALASAFRAAMLKKEALFARDRSATAQQAMAWQFQTLAAITYLNQPEVYRQVQRELKQYPTPKTAPVIGGRLISLVSRLFGWRTAKRLQFTYVMLFRSQK